MNLEKELEHISNGMGLPPRKFNWIDRKFINKCSEPKWDWKEGDLSVTIYNWDNMLINGKLGWGHIIQANSLLYEHGKYNCPGELLISKEKHNLMEMQIIASKLFGLKGNSDAILDEEEKEYALHLEDELTAKYGVPVPKAIGGSSNYFISACYFQRSHFPVGYIVNGLFPVLYLDESPFTVMVVPDLYWSKEFKKWWRSH